MPTERRGCGVCDSINRSSLVCPACINNTLLFERRKVLQELSERREGVLTRLNELLAQRHAHQLQQQQRQHAVIAARQATLRANKAEQNLEAAKLEVAELTRNNNARRNRHEKVATQLAAIRTEVLSNHFSTLLRYQSLTHSHVSAMLLREQRLKLQQLLDILPLRISALRSGGGAPIQVTLLSLKLPDTLSASALMVQSPEATSASLGYTVLFLDLISTYMGGPLLHEGSFQGSTTVLWQQQSFWNRRPSSSNSRLPLFLEGDSSTPLPNPFPSISAKVRSASGWGSPPLARALSSTPDSRQATAERQLDEALQRQRNADLKAAYDLLQRSVSCFVKDKVNTFSLRLPPSWSPFGWLVILCAMIKRDERTEGVLTAASSMADQGAENLMFMGDENGMHHDPDDDEEMEGWDVVQPIMPPPPSQPDEVEQWTRAMFTDAHQHANGGQGLSMERVRSIFSR